FIWNPNGKGKKADIKDGERRYRILKSIGYKELRFGKEFIYVEKKSDEALEIGTLITCCMREDLTPIEKAKALMNLAKRKGIKSLDIAMCSFNRAKDYTSNDFLSEPNARNYFVSKEVIEDLAVYMKAIGIGGTNAVDLISLLNLPDDIQKKIYFSSGHTLITREKTKLNRYGRLVKREKNDQGVMIPMTFAKELSRLNNDPMVRFFLKKALQQSWSSKRLNRMVTDFLSSQLTSDQYMKAYVIRDVESHADKASKHDLVSLTHSMDHMASTLTSFRTINLVAMAPDFDKKSIAISAAGLKQSAENLLKAVNELLCSTVQLQKIQDAKREEVVNKSFQVIMRSSPHTPGPAFRFSMPTDVGKALQEKYSLQQDDVLELKVVSVIQKGVIITMKEFDNWVQSKPKWVEATIMSYDQIEAEASSNLPQH
ncbi:MAG: hypothetical protein NT163_12950, partial [Chlorobiales bacterium]|nr:hypothetical protein [Chlorobiales bacterium]